MVFNINDNGEIEDFEVDWLGEKVYVSMEEAEIYDKELEKQMSLILDNVKEWDVQHCKKIFRYGKQPFKRE